MEDRESKVTKIRNYGKAFLCVAVFGIIVFCFFYKSKINFKDAYGLIFPMSIFGIFFLYIFFTFAFWKLDYNDEGFFYKAYKKEMIPYSQVVEVTHYTNVAYRRNVNIFIIVYKGIDHFSGKEENIKMEINHFPRKQSMREFFSTMKEANQNIVFKTESAGSDGIETKDFDYFIS